MFGIRYLKAPPTTYILHYVNGKVKREGAGLSFFYYAPTTTLVGVPVNSADVPFVFNQPTADFQNVMVQGQLQYRIADPKRVAALLDFSILNNNPDLHTSDDPEKLPERLVQATQVLCQTALGKMNLRNALISAEKLVVEVLAGLKEHEAVKMLGLEILGLAILALKPTPEMAKALEAEAREELQKKSDDAIYARRSNAVEQERRIKEGELNTELAVEEKRREIREAQMAADVAVEQQRAALIEQRAVNEKKDADAKAYALEATLKPVRETDPRTLFALAAGNADPRTTIALAFRELAENAGKIGTLSITPELLEGLMRKK